MDLFQTVDARASYRGPYEAKAVPQDHLKRIVSAGLKAPSGYNDQTTSFVIVDEQQVISSIAELLGNPRLKEAPAMIVACINQDTRPREYDFSVENYAAACAHILLATTAMGYASVWIDGSVRRDDRAARIAELLSVPETFAVRAVLPVGTPSEPPEQKAKTEFGERAFFNTFGATS